MVASWYEEQMDLSLHLGLDWTWTVSEVNCNPLCFLVVF